MILLIDGNPANSSMFSISNTEEPQKPFMNIIFSEGDFEDSCSVWKKKKKKDAPKNIKRLLCSVNLKQNLKFESLDIPQ